MTQQRDPRFVGIERRITVFIAAAVFGIALMLVIIGVKRDVFVRKADLYFVCESARGIQPGIAVTYRGLHIGKVTGVGLSDAGRIRVELAVRRKALGWIGDDSVATCTRDGFVGATFIDIMPGKDDAPPIRENASLAFTPQKDLSDLADLRGDILPLLNQTTELIASFNDPDGDVKKLLHQINKMSRDLDGTRSNVDSLLQNSEEAIVSLTARLSSLLDAANQTLESANASLKKVDERLPSMLGNTDKILENVQGTTDTLNKTMGRAAPKIPGMMDDAAQAAEDAKELTEATKKMWPFRSRVKKPEERTLKLDSHE